VKRTLIIVAHGSRRQASNDEISELAKKVMKFANGNYDEVMCAYLEIASPSIPQAIEQCIDNNANSEELEITILPYFLAAGRHVTEDIPHEVDRVSRPLNNVNICIKPHIGSAENMAETILAISR